MRKEGRQEALECFRVLLFSDPGRSMAVQFAGVLGRLQDADGIYVLRGIIAWRGGTRTGSPIISNYVVQSHPSLLETLRSPPPSSRRIS